MQDVGPLCFQCLMKVRMKNPNLTQEELATSAVLNEVNDAITIAPTMINVPGAMGPVPMIVNGALCFDCMPAGKEESGLIKAPNGLITP